jgi:hypothetical protein
VLEINTVPLLWFDGRGWYYRNCGIYDRDGECAGGKRESITGGDGITTAKRKIKNEKTTEHKIE